MLPLGGNLVLSLGDVVLVSLGHAHLVGALCRVSQLVRPETEIGLGAAHAIDDLLLFPEHLFHLLMFLLLRGVSFGVAVLGRGLGNDCSARGQVRTPQLVDQLASLGSCICLAAHARAAVAISVARRRVELIVFAQLPVGPRQILLRDVRLRLPLRLLCLLVDAPVKLPRVVAETEVGGPDLVDLLHSVSLGREGSVHDEGLVRFHANGGESFYAEARVAAWTLAEPLCLLGDLALEQGALHSHRLRNVVHLAIVPAQHVLKRRVSHGASSNICRRFHAHG